MKIFTYKRLRKYIYYRDKLVAFLRLMIVPGFKNVPLYDVLVFFFNGLFNGVVSIRASAIAFNFFLAIFPLILFLFTLIPYIPIDQFQETLFELFAEVIPPETFAMVEKTIYEIVMKQNSSLLSLSFILTFIFATNGISAIIDGFNSSWHHMEIKSFIQQRLMSVFLLIILSVMVIVSIAVMTLGGSFIGWFVDRGLIQGTITIYTLEVLKWIITLSLTFFSISFLYYYAPAKRKKFRFFSPGSILATILLTLATLGFNYYITNFSQYNALYGSIGTLIIFLMWLFINAFILLIGFELNISILKASIEPNEILKEKGNRVTYN
ncbi:MAG: YihY/virulence factor BrkB family protein [Bacteroidetes bacterium]|nr:YihY/virulence factor BrkB family protein [Bacteroidota bacterium]